MTKEDNLLSELLNDCFELSEEFFSKGDVSRDTLLLVAARTRLMIGQAKAQMAAEDAQEAAVASEAGPAEDSGDGDAETEEVPAPAGEE